MIKNMYMFEEQEECIWSHMIDHIIRSGIKNLVAHRRGQQGKVVWPLQYNRWRPRCSFFTQLVNSNQIWGDFSRSLVSSRKASSLQCRETI